MRRLARMPPERRVWAHSALIAAALLTVRIGEGAQPGLTPDQARFGTSEEVLVRGTRLRELKAAIVVAEDRFYARYNELNLVDDYDIDCRMDAHTGTRIPQRRCFAKLLLKAMALEGEEALRAFQDHPKPQDMPGAPPSEPRPAGMSAAGSVPHTNPEAEWLAHFDDYRDNMLYLLAKHPELQRLARAAEDAKKRYDSEYRRRLKGRLVVR